MAQPAESRPVAADSVMLDLVTKAFTDGNADALAGLAATRLEVSVFGTGALYSRAQAVHVLRDFFRRYPAARVNLREQVVSEDARTVTGQYWEEGSETPVEVYVRLRRVGTAWQLASLTLERAAADRTDGR